MPKIQIISLGGVSKILNNNLFKPYLPLAIDTNQKNLDNLSKDIETLCLGEGQGSGGEPSLAQSFFDKQKVEPLIKGDILVLVAGLAGGTGAGLAPEIIKLAKDNQIKIIFIGFLPLASENKKEKAEIALEEIKKLNIPVLIINNEEIWQTMPNETMEKDFWQVANYPVLETCRVLNNLTLSSQIDTLDLFNALSYSGFFYSNVVRAENYEKMLEKLHISFISNFTKESFQNAKNFLLSYKGNFNKIQKEEFLGMFETIGLVKASQEETEEEDFTINVLITGIQKPEQKQSQDYLNLILEKQEESEKERKSIIASQNGSQKGKK